MSTAPTESSSRFRARAMTPWGNSSSSPAMHFVEAVDAGDAVAHGEDGADLGDVDPGGEARRAAPG